MKKAVGQKGFTLAELLVVVAIVAVLVAIAIPVFTAQLNRANAATDEANIRSGYASAQTLVISSTVPQGTVYVLLSDGNVVEYDGITVLANAYRTKGESKDAAGASDSDSVGISGQEVQWDAGEIVTYEVIADRKVIILSSGGGGSGGENPGEDGPGGSGDGSVIVTDSSGKEHTITPTGDWQAVKERPNDGDGSRLGVGSIYVDETGTYVIGDNDSVRDIANKTLADVAASGQAYRIDASTSVWTDNDKASNGAWSQTGPQKGDIVYWKNSYYVATGSLGVWTSPPGGFILLK